MNATPITSETKPTKTDPSAPPDSPEVIVFPPVLFVSAILIGVALQIMWPIPLWKALPVRIAGGALVMLGFTMLATAFRAMGRAGTNVHPGKPSTAIVSDGPYRFTRNPIYAGNTLVYIGLSLIFNVFWPLVSLVPFFILLDWGVVRREERYLEAKFGWDYSDYKARVRRWI
jgi:protein-S-isoprenylcysteine O-methyltransferase Ste14